MQLCSVDTKKQFTVASQSGQQQASVCTRLCKRNCEGFANERCLVLCKQVLVDRCETENAAA